MAVEVILAAWKQHRDQWKDWELGGGSLVVLLCRCSVWKEEYTPWGLLAEWIWCFACLADLLFGGRGVMACLSLDDVWSVVLTIQWHQRSRVGTPRRCCPDATHRDCIFSFPVSSRCSPHATRPGQMTCPPASSAETERPAVAEGVEKLRYGSASLGPFRVNLSICLSVDYYCYFAFILFFHVFYFSCSKEIVFPSSNSPPHHHHPQLFFFLLTASSLFPLHSTSPPCHMSLFPSPPSKCRTWTIEISKPLEYQLLPSFFFLFHPPRSPSLIPAYAWCPVCVPKSVACR